MSEIIDRMDQAVKHQERVVVEHPDAPTILALAIMTETLRATARATREQLEDFQRCHTIGNPDNLLKSLRHLGRAAESLREQLYGYTPKKEDTK